MDVPCLNGQIVEAPEIPAPVAVVGNHEWNEEREEAQSRYGRVNRPVHAAEEVPELERISKKGYIEAQSADPWRHFIATKAEEGQKRRFNRNDRRLFVHNAALDQRALRKRVLHLAYYQTLVGHPGTTCMYQSLRCEFYWPSMAL